MASMVRGRALLRRAVVTVGLLVPTTAFAQGATDPTPTPAQPPPTSSGSTGTGTAGATATTPDLTTPSSSTSPTTEPPSAPSGAPDKKDAKWYDSVNFGAFVDTYYSH